MRYYKPLLLLSAFCFSLVLACGGSSEQSSTKKEAETLIPEGFEILDTDTLAIGMDTYVVNALKYENEDSLAGYTNELIRPLTILKKETSSEFELMARNDSIILCRVCGGIFGDPWEGLETEENTFIIYHMGGSSDRWTRNIKFQYDSEKRGWYMISDRGVSFSTYDPEGTYEKSIYTEDDSLGLVPFESFKTEF